MRVYTLLALVGSVVIAKDNTEKEAERIEKEQKLTNQIEGAKSFYDGYYKSFYRVNKSDENLDKCMDEKTITNMVNIGEIVENPLSMFSMKNIKADLNLFGEFAEVAGDLSACHFESSGKDIWDLCT